MADYGCYCMLKAMLPLRGEMRESTHKRLSLWIGILVHWCSNHYFLGLLIYLSRNPQLHPPNEGKRIAVLEATDWH